ncbi:hypothetical protein F4775DRAFT_594681 [Biscogniauxia sp. FL1348]|nr:hypothetical protein F4775DRAFT_594681 [Biscogniauxia sp. FL1348]
MASFSPRSILKKNGQSSPVSKRVAFHEGLAFDIVTGDQIHRDEDWIVVDSEEVMAEEELDVPPPSIAGLFVGFLSAFQQSALAVAAKESEGVRHAILPFLSLSEDSCAIPVPIYQIYGKKCNTARRGLCDLRFRRRPNHLVATLLCPVRPCWRAAFGLLLGGRFCLVGNHAK